VALAFRPKREREGACSILNCRRPSASFYLLRRGWSMRRLPRICIFDLNEALPTSTSLSLFLLWPCITSSSSVHTTRHACVLAHVTAISDGPHSGNYDLARIACSV
jgi:hypothetical protein